MKNWNLRESGNVKVENLVINNNEGMYVDENLLLKVVEDNKNIIIENWEKLFKKEDYSENIWEEKIKNYKEIIGDQEGWEPEAESYYTCDVEGVIEDFVLCARGSFEDGILKY